MSVLDDLREEATTIRKWAGEKSDWLENPQVLRRYGEDPATLNRRRHETSVMFRAAHRLDQYAQILADREKAA